MVATAIGQKHLMPDIDERVSKLERDMVELQTTVRIQLKDLYNRTKRVEAVLWAAQTASTVLLLTILTKMQ